MDSIDRLLTEHEALRRDAAALEALLGPQRGVGWDDESDCDVAAFRAARDRLAHDLMEHEAREEKLIGRRLHSPGQGEMEAEVERAHKTLNSLVSLLQSAAELCTQKRVHRLRTIVSRVREELETHLGYEEKVLFPLLRGSSLV
ncbi:MAG: hemerythrin domain-containing protein [Elusimicrobiota bacterium]|nr:hemerythrin domain-containing protein [Elusimicrobiota bacterium]